MGFGGFVTDAGLVGLFGFAVALPTRRTGGVGRLDVLMTVLPALWGKGGGAGLCIAWPCSFCSVFTNPVSSDEPRALRGGAGTPVVGEVAVVPW